MELSWATALRPSWAGRTLTFYARWCQFARRWAAVGAGALRNGKRHAARHQAPRRADRRRGPRPASHVRHLGSVHIGRLELADQVHGVMQHADDVNPACAVTA